MKNLEIEGKYPKIYWIIMAIAVLIGTFIRFNGLGKWPLALDEYYIIKSCGFILNHGLPQFPNGGYYVRGILLQYMIVPLLAIGLKAELAGRLITVIANLITIPALYLIAKRVSNQFVATMVVVIFSLSVWEIEFARFARMYTPFQAIFIWYMYFVLVDFKNKNFKNYKWLLTLSAISLFVYEGSIFLAVFNFVPFVINRKFKPIYFLSAIVTFFLSVFINVFNFRKLGTDPNFYPQNYLNLKSHFFASPIKIPEILLPFTFDGIISTLLVILLASLNLFLLYKILKSSKFNYWDSISIIFLVILAFTNQFGLFLLVFILVLFWNLLNSSFLSVKVLSFLGSIFIIDFIFWLAFGLLTKNWYVLFNDFSSFTFSGILKRLIVGFFNYPDNYYTIFTYFKTLPLLTAFSAIFSSLLIIYLLFSKRQNENIKFVFGSLIFVGLLSTIPTILYKETRYTFFAVPLLIIVVNFSVYTFSKLVFKDSLRGVVAFAVIVLGLFILSKDFNAYHLKNIASEEVNYRMNYNNKMKKHLYRRWDIKTPVDYVINHMKPTDKIMINEDTPDYYLPKVDYYSFDYRHRAFIALSIEHGTKERWTNSKLINNNKDLINLLDSGKETIWFLVFPEHYLTEINFYERYKNNMVYEGVDKMIKVFKFPSNN